MESGFFLREFCLFARKYKVLFSWTLEESRQFPSLQHQVSLSQDFDVNACSLGFFRTILLLLSWNLWLQPGQWLHLYAIQNKNRQNPSSQITELLSGLVYPFDFGAVTCPCLGLMGCYMFSLSRTSHRYFTCRTAVMHTGFNEISPTL